MATLVPDLSNAKHSRGKERELDVLYRLELSLPKGYEIFHNISWHSLHEDKDKHGEIDFVVLSPLGNVLLVEVKAGEVTIANGQMTKQYEDGPPKCSRYRVDRS